jgi:hypothetical protein
MRRQVTIVWIVFTVLFLISACGTVMMGTRGDFSDKDREIIAAYYSHLAPPPTPGPGTYRTKQAQKKSTTERPNIMGKKLARGAGFPLPEKLERSLSPLDKGLARAMVGWNVVIVNISSRKVVDRVHAMGY